MKTFEEKVKFLRGVDCKDRSKLHGCLDNAEAAFADGEHERSRRILERAAVYAWGPWRPAEWYNSDGLPREEIRKHAREVVGAMLNGRCQPEASDVERLGLSEADANRVILEIYKVLDVLKNVLDIQK